MLISLLRFLLRLLYGFQTWNDAVLKTPGPVLLLPNHVSWWDWLLIGVCLDDDWRFVTSSTTAETSWFHKKIMVNRRTFPVDMNSPYAVKHMAEYLQAGGRLVMFPEGRISRTGSLMKLFEGTGFLIHKTNPRIITAYLRSAQRLPFSRNSDRKQLFPRISVHFSDPLPVPPPDHHASSETRARLTDWVRDRMVGQQFETEMKFGPGTLPEAIAATARRQAGRSILQDSSMKQLNYRRIFAGADVLKGLLADHLEEAGPRIGVLLPNVNAQPLVLLALWAAGKTPAVLNYTTGPSVLLSCARLAQLKLIVTSTAFITRAKLDLQPLLNAGIRIVFLEDLSPKATALRKLSALIRNFRPNLRPITIQPEDPALVLFTSGSEGEPKGVELTHRNVLANIRQMLSVVDLYERDRFFNALPLFHSFGLTVGLLLPLVQGVFVFLYLSPLHYRVVPAAFYNLDCTVLFGTNTFLLGYARKAHPYDFCSLRYVFAGAEKLQASTSRVWSEKFGVRVLEGYGATECSPCLSANVPIHPRAGSAGKFLPGVAFRLEPVEGIADADHAGRLFVKGPNVMRGYLNPEANEKFQALGGWYDTGDIARVDADGFLHILGRLKRFAKISGEMVSLTAVEEALADAFPHYGPKFGVAVVSRPDEMRGEKLVAVTNEPRLGLDEIREAIRSRGLSNLAVPREMKHLPELPRLGTGKIDHRRLQSLVQA